MNKKSQTLVCKTIWKEELLKFQLAEDGKSFADLKIKCVDGYFLAHKIVFAMCSEIEWEEKNSRSMAVWIVNYTLEETAKIMLLAYTGEILLVNNWTILDELVKIFKLSEEKLNWGVPYNERNNLFRILAQKRVRATRCCSLSNTEKEIFIYGNGDIKYVSWELEAKNIESISYFKNVGYPCLHCSCIFTDVTDFNKHEEECHPVIVKIECQSPSPKANEIICKTSPEIRPTQHASQKKIAICPEEIRCFVCGQETNSVMQLVDHFQAVHKVVPGQDYCKNPIKCNGCHYSRSGSNMSAFLSHVHKCKKEAETKLKEITNANVEGKSSEEASQNPQKPHLPIRAKRKRVEGRKSVRNTTTKTTNFNDTLPLPKNGKTLNTKTNKSILTPKNCTTEMIATALAAAHIMSKVSPSITVELQQENHKVKGGNKPDTSVNTPLDIMNTTLPLITSKECENKTPKFVIPKKVKIVDKNIQHKSPINSSKPAEKYLGPLKTPENPEEKVANAGHLDVRKRLVFKDMDSKGFYTLTPKEDENKAPETQQEQNLTSSPMENKQGCSLRQEVSTVGALTPEKDLSNNELGQRLMILANTPRLLIPGTDDAIEMINRTTAPKRKKRKTSSLCAQQVVKEQNLSCANPFPATISTDTNINTQPLTSSKYKWLCSYCRSKFTSQVFYMRHSCKSFSTKRPTFGQQPKATYIMKTRRGLSVPGKKKVVPKRH